MTERIARLTELTLKGETYACEQDSNCDREDIFLEQEDREGKRICEALEKCEPILTPYSKFTGYFNSNGKSFPGNVFHRKGHKNFQALAEQFYLKAVDNLVTFEWQHAAADYKQVLKIGLFGLVKEIDKSLSVHENEKEKRYLLGLKRVAIGMIAWTKRCSKLVLDYAKTDPNGIACGSTVTNVTIDETLIKNDEYFEKTVDMLETYFKNGGVHFQLTYVSKEDLISAKKKPENYGNLRVRVTGFSDYFVKLKESIQDSIISRTEHNR